MEQLYCSVLNCNKPLSSVSEVVNGFCDCCFEKLDDKRYYIGVCWHCQTVTFVGEKKMSIRTKKKRHDIEIADKYICAKGCSKCNNDPKAGVMWMTINKKEPSVWAVSENGALIPCENLMKEESHSINNMLDTDQKE